MSPKIIGVTGGSGSGKSYLVEKLVEYTSQKFEISVISEDSYYLNFDKLPLDKRAKQNFDHPDSLDFELFNQNISELKQGKVAKVPVYDFKTHLRSPETTLVQPSQYIIIEGILLLSNIPIVEQIDYSIYVETPSDIRFIRRLKRDIEERGRTTDSVIDQYLSTVKPMYEQFIAPTIKLVDRIVDGEWSDVKLLNEICADIESL